MAASSSESRVYEYNLAIRFQAQVERCSEQAAIWLDAHHAISHDELNRSANRLARRLLRSTCEVRRKLASSASTNDSAVVLPSYLPAKSLRFHFSFSISHFSSMTNEKPESSKGKTSGSPVATMNLLL